MSLRKSGVLLKPKNPNLDRRAELTPEELPFSGSSVQGREDGVRVFKTITDVLSERHSSPHHTDVVPSPTESVGRPPPERPTRSTPS